MAQVLDLTQRLEEKVQKRRGRRKAAEEKALKAVKEEPKEKLTVAQRKRLEAIEELMRASEEVPDWLTIVDSIPALNAMVEDLAQNEIFALDVETNSLDWTRAKLVAVAYYSPKSERAYFVPIGMKDQKYRNIALADYVAAVKALHANSAVKKVNHNIKYDAHVLREHGCPLDGIAYDTLIAMKVLDETLESYALKWLVSYYLDYPAAYKFDELFEGNFAEAPYPIAHLYAGKDPKYAYDLMQFQLKYLNMPQYEGLRRVLYEVELPLIPIVIEMEANGFRVDLEYLKEQSEKVDRLLKDLMDELWRAIAAPGLAYLRRRLKEEKATVRRLLRERGFEVEEGEDDTAVLTLQAIGKIAYGPLGYEEPRSKRVTKHGLAKLKDPVVDAMLACVDTYETIQQIEAAGRWELNFASPHQVAMLLFDVLGLPEVDGRSTGDDTLLALSKTVDDPSQVVTKIDDEEVMRIIARDVPDLGEGALMGDKLEALKRAAYAGDKDGHPTYYVYGWRGAIVDKLREFRELEKVKTAFLDAIPEVLGADGKMHTSLNQYGTKTGRFSSSGVGKKRGEKMGMNLQQIPNALSKINVRQAFLPPFEGDWLLCGIDYSQIEPRLATHLSQAKAWLEAYREGKDVYIRTASVLHGIPEEQVTTKQRKDVKAVALGLIYGLTKYGLSANLGITPDEAEAFREQFLDAIPELRADIEKAHRECRENGYVTDWMGRKRRLPEIWTPPIRVERNGYVFYKPAPEVARAERQSYNFKIQAGAQEIIKLAMGKIARMRAANPERYTFHFVLQIHDEIIFAVPKDWAELREVDGKDPKTGEPIKVKKWFPKEGSPILDIAKAMTDVVQLSVPLKVDIALGERWGELD